MPWKLCATNNRFCHIANVNTPNKISNYPYLTLKTICFTVFFKNQIKYWKHIHVKVYCSFVSSRNYENSQNHCLSGSCDAIDVKRLKSGFKSTCQYLGYVAFTAISYNWRVNWGFFERQNEKLFKTSSVIRHRLASQKKTHFSGSPQQQWFETHIRIVKIFR